jgi:hypothetical protein
MIFSGTRLPPSDQTGSKFPTLFERWLLELKFQE